MEIVLRLDPTQADIDAVIKPLSAYNDEATGRDSQYRQIAFHILDPKTHQPVGGLAGWTNYDWLFVVMLFVPAELRGQGYGRELMNRAEIYAREQGMVGIWLDTFEFQAKGFYERLGFTLFGTLDDQPVGGRRYFFSKRFVAPTA